MAQIVSSEQPRRGNSSVVGENTNNGTASGPELTIVNHPNPKNVEEKANWAGKQGKTPGGIGFALTFLLLAFLCVKTKKSKSQLRSRCYINAISSHLILDRDCNASVVGENTNNGSENSTRSERKVKASYGHGVT